MGVVAPALARETPLRTGAADADAAGIGNVGRHETTPGVVGHNSDNPEPLPPAACEEAPSPGPSISWAGEEAAEFTEDDDEGSVDAESVKEESETPVRLTGPRIGLEPPTRRLTDAQLTRASRYHAGLGGADRRRFFQALAAQV